MSEVEILSDEYKRDIRGPAMEAALNRAQAMDPGGIYAKDGRQGLPIQRDPLGNPLKRIHEVDMDDMVAQEVGRLFVATGHTSIGVPSPNRHERYVPKDLYNKHLAIYGPELNKILLATMSSPSYQKLNDEQKSRVIQKQAQKVREKYGKLLDLEMIEEDPTYRKAMLSPLKEAFAKE